MKSEFPRYFRHKLWTVTLFIEIHNETDSGLFYFSSEMGRGKSKNLKLKTCLDDKNFIEISKSEACLML